MTRYSALGARFFPYLQKYELLSSLITNAAKECLASHVEKRRRSPKRRADKLLLFNLNASGKNGAQGRIRTTDKIIARLYAFDRGTFGHCKGESAVCKEQM